jgi:hypothetical protein
MSMTSLAAIVQMLPGARRSKCVRLAVHFFGKLHAHCHAHPDAHCLIVTDAHCEYIDCAEVCHMPQHTDTLLEVLPVPVFSVTGRRVVEWDFLAKQLDRGCTICNHTHRLTLSNVTKEQPYGLASVMDFTCDRCGGVTPLSTNKCHKTTQKARRGAYDVNTKAALG